MAEYLRNLVIKGTSGIAKNTRNHVSRSLFITPLLLLFEPTLVVQPLKSSGVTLYFTYFTVDENTSSMARPVLQPGLGASWSRLSVQMGCETPP
jgi:hypothetical protein